MRNWIWTLLAAPVLSACAGMQTEPATTTAAILTDYDWQLREVSDSQGQLLPGWTLPPAPVDSANPKDAVQLSFSQERIGLSHLCNVLSATYHLDGPIMQIDPVIGTMMYCADPALMALEQQVAQRLPQANRWSVAAASPHTKGPALTLFFADGGQWLLEGEPTPAKLYGSAGEQIFLEVAPQRVSCSHPLIPHYQCLQVRSIEYDSQGRKNHVGAWENFYSEIQGYQHQPGVRNVLRIKRYQRPNAPTDSSSYVYVLDLTVESEISH